MLYITQIIYINEGKESVFERFENVAIPLMKKYNGKIIHRIRPSKGDFIDNDSSETPYEIHIMSFDSEIDLNNFLKDDERKKLKHLKDDSVKSTFLIKGVEM